jgi:hypothetical protein
MSADLSDYLSVSEKQDVMDHIVATTNWSTRALNSERIGEFLEANRCWREVFGAIFPINPDTPSEPGDYVGLTKRIAKSRAALPTESAETLSHVAVAPHSFSGRTERFEIVLPRGTVLRYGPSGGNFDADKLVAYARDLIREKRIADARIMLEQVVPAFTTVLGDSDTRTREVRLLLDETDPNERPD